MAANAGRHNNKALESVTFIARRSVGGSGTERETQKVFIMSNLHWTVKHWKKQTSSISTKDWRQRGFHTDGLVWRLFGLSAIGTEKKTFLKTQSAEQIQDQLLWGYKHRLFPDSTPATDITEDSRRETDKNIQVCDRIYSACNHRAVLYLLFRRIQRPVLKLYTWIKLQQNKLQHSRVMAKSLIGSLSSSPRMEMTLTS